LGSDTGGSIREPADFCGIVGLKPTYGAVSRYGLIPMSSSLDQIGPLTNTVEDAAIVFRAIAGEDPHDSTSASVTYGEELTDPKLEHIREMTIGLPKEYFIAGIDKEIIANVEGAIAQFKGLNVRFKEISLPHTKYALSTYYIIMAAEASSNLARLEGIRYARVPEAEDAADLMDRYIKNRSHGFGAEVKRRIILGTFVLSSGHYDAYYAKAQKVRALIRRDFNEVFKDVDAILTPVSPTPPFAIGEKTNNPLTMYLSDIFTITANLAGLPALAMPPNFQLIGKPFHEADILGLGQYFERIRR
jgi:aspartyl-tRNA(Asn)/glutamyl-tRNA(Gln) amidotransferase subunit A